MSDILNIIGILIVILSMFLIFSFISNFLEKRKNEKTFHQSSEEVDYKAIEIKYRIFPIVDSNGDVEFYPQYNVWGDDKEFSWKFFYSSDRTQIYSFPTEEEAREFLKEHGREETERVKKYRETKKRYSKPIYVEI